MLEQKTKAMREGPGAQQGADLAWSATVGACGVHGHAGKEKRACGTRGCAWPLLKRVWQKQFCLKRTLEHRGHARKEDEASLLGRWVCTGSRPRKSVVWAHGRPVGPPFGTCNGLCYWA